jgi:hypothetical protein
MGRSNGRSVEQSIQLLESKLTKVTIYHEIRLEEWAFTEPQSN